MKPINEYAMQECLDRLYDVVGCGYDRKSVEVLRIGTLLYEQAQRHDARVDALENTINALRAKHHKPDSPIPSGQVAGMRDE